LQVQEAGMTEQTSIEDQDYEAFADWHRAEQGRLAALKKANRVGFFFRRPLKMLALGRFPYFRAALTELDQKDFDAYFDGPGSKLMLSAITAAPGIPAIISASYIPESGWGVAGAIVFGGLTLMLGSASISLAGKLGVEHRKVKKALMTRADYLRMTGQDPAAILAKAEAEGRGIEDRLTAYFASVAVEELRPTPAPLPAQPVDRKSRGQAVQALRDAVKTTPSNKP
jgi:hypothetical protein